MITGLGLQDRGAPEDDAPADGGPGPEFLVTAAVGPLPRGRRPAVVASGIVHALLVLLLVQVVRAPSHEAPAREEEPRVLARLSFPRAPLPRARQRISVGPPDEHRARDLVLRRDEDITKSERGTTKIDPGLEQRAQQAESLAAPPPPQDVPPLPRALQRAAWPQSPMPLQAAAARAVATSNGAWGEPSATTRRMGPLSFDPQGADFTLWVQHFKDEVYRNWTIPQTALFGWGGEVPFEFVVERDGTMSRLSDLGTSGTRSLDRAARNALEASRLLPLPRDYAPSSVTIRVVFVYGRPVATEAAASSTR